MRSTQGGARGAGAGELVSQVQAASRQAGFALYPVSVGNYWKFSHWVSLDDYGHIL